jgi:DNA polymerase-3 subunit delta'
MRWIISRTTWAERMARRKQPAGDDVTTRDHAAMLARAGAPWLRQAREQLAAARRDGKLAHGILLHGTSGAGQSALALWTANLVLCQESGTAPCGRCRSCVLFLAGNHPDFYSVELEAKASYIKVDQIRELCGKLTLRSYSGGGKAGVIDPADKMNPQANNALLKTLEEPPEETFLILAASRLDRLPRTVVSRCQRVRIATPPGEEAVAWLNGELARQDWPDLLKLAAGAPFRALDLAGEGAGELTGEMRTVLAQGGSGGALDPLELAAQWSKDRPAARLAWLEGWLESQIRERASGSDVVNNNHDFRLPSAGVGVNIKSAFALLDKVRDARQLLESSLNTQLLLEDLLVQFVDALAGRTAGRMEIQG